MNIMYRFIAVVLVSLELVLTTGQAAGGVGPDGCIRPERPSTPITVDDIKALTATGVKPDAITKEIDISQSKFSPQDITTAQQANPPVNADVIAYMKNHPKELNTGIGDNSAANAQRERQQFQSGNSEVLTNNSIVELVKAGMSEEIVISMIKTQPTKFDVGVGGVLLLKSNSVSDTIINEMVVRGQGAIVAPATRVISDPVVEKLCESLEQDNPGKVIAALKTLRNLKATEAASRILPCLTDSNPNVVRETCRTLVVIGNQEAVPAITPLLMHERPDIIREACRTIALIGNNDAIAAIEPLLMNSRSDIREEAYKAIKKLQAQSAEAITPVTVEDVKTLAAAGVKTDAIKQEIETSKSKFSAQDIVAAQQAHVDPAVIECMKSHSY